jgi:hypothetical protein
MSNEDRIRLLEHRVRELQTAVVAIVRYLGIGRQVAEVERAQLDEIRLSRDPESPRERIIELYRGPPSER